MRCPCALPHRSESRNLDLDLATRSLAELGFSDTEALVYCDLLRAPNRTGYAVAKALKKSQANVYSALAALAAKGAVEFSNGDTRSYKAVQPSELLPRLSKEFEERCASAKAMLSNITGTASEDRIYQLKNPDHVFERAFAMIARAEQSIAFELFSFPFQRVAPALADAVGRGVGVAGVTFDPGDVIEGAECVLSVKFGRRNAWPQAPAWPRDHMALIVDAREALVALFDRHSHEVLHAFYTDSIYISCLFHASVIDGLVLNLERPKALEESLNKRLFGTVPQGFIDLING